MFSLLLCSITSAIKSPVRGFVSYSRFSLFGHLTSKFLNSSSVSKSRVAKSENENERFFNNFGA